MNYPNDFINKIVCGDCLEVMKNIPDKSVDMILADPPYGTISCKWDIIIPFKPLWMQLERIIKPKGTIAMTANQPFTSTLIISNIDMFKYCWVWDKKIPSGMSYARYRPMSQHEDIVIFCSGKTTYNAQKVKRDKPIKGGGMKNSESAMTKNYKALKKIYTHKNPTTIIPFDKVRRGSLHPTQKPVALMEYLIRTYTNKNELVLDFAIGSGTTAVACKNLDRDFIGIDILEEYCKIARKRIDGC